MFHEKERVLIANHANVQRRRQLNLRAGRTVFDLTTQEELARFLQNAARGASSVSTVPDWEALLLPPPDDSLVTMVLAQNPDVITVLGHELSVQYLSLHGGVWLHYPVVKLPAVVIQDRTWRNLPDEGVVLPSGRRVELSLLVSPLHPVTDINGAAFKHKVGEGLNELAWTRWEKPTLPTPTEQLAPIKECQYGTCENTGAPLVAYGVTRPDWDFSWNTEWTTSQTRAQQWWDDAKRRFTEVQDGGKKKVLRAKLRSLYDAEYHRLAPELQTRLYQLLNSFSSQPIATLEAVIAEVEQATTAAPRQNKSGIDFSRFFGGSARVRKD
jgi:hypothetical protein